MHMLILLDFFVVSEGCDVCLGASGSYHTSGGDLRRNPKV